MCRNKTILGLLVVSVFLVGCDRRALEGLNLKINAEIKSGYEKGKDTASPQPQQQSQTVSPGNNGNTEATSETPQQQDNVITSQPKGNNKTSSDKTDEAASPPSPSPGGFAEKSESESPQVQVKVKESDPDAPMPFKEIPECSPAGITAKTNEIFYARNPQIKSI